MEKLDITRHKREHTEIFDHFGYGSLGYCMYCGTSQGRLTKEHIIGRGIGGTITLAKSSCVPCAEITRDMEQFCFNNMMKFFRLKYGFRTSQRRQKTVKVWARANDEERYQLDLPLYQLPAFLMVPKVPPPMKIVREWKDEMELFVVVPDMEWPKNKVFSQGPIKGDVYGRMLAKIAHGYAIAEVGQDKFEAILSKIITDANSRPFDWIGCLNQTPKINLAAEPQILHKLSLEWWETKLGLLLVVKIRLFAYLGAPEYHVIVGKIDEPPIDKAHRAYRSKPLSLRR